jgi:peptide-methionine (S)-S-oxide reductase
VCTDETGHAEVVELNFDPQKVSYEELVRLFFQLHDPTQLNRQGPDFGTQYRSAIFYHSPAQKEIAERVRDEFQKLIRGKIVTQIEPAQTFYRAEDYHQKYLEKRGLKACHI